jgi:CheY-like chemotaxis protein
VLLQGKDEAIVRGLTRFWFSFQEGSRLRAHEQEVQDMLELDSKNFPPGQGRGQGCRQQSTRCGILVVDDDEGVRSLLNFTMRQQGFAVWLAADGQEALDLYRHHRDTIDVVLLDVRMPGMDGPQTLAKLHQLNPQICCCFMSGDLGSYTEGQLGNLGARAVLLKPFHLGQLARVLWELANHEE